MEADAYQLCQVPFLHGLPSILNSPAGSPDQCLAQRRDRKNFLHQLIGSGMQASHPKMGQGGMSDE